MAYVFIILSYIKNKILLLNKPIRYKHNTANYM